MLALAYIAGMLAFAYNPPRVSERQWKDPAMRVTSARDLGLMSRARRKQIRLSQEELARLAGVSRWWISEFESGKARVELDLVLRAVSSLGMVLDLSIEELKSDHDARSLPAIDLDEVLAQYQGGGSDT